MIDKIKKRLESFNKMPYKYIPRQDLLKIIELQAEALERIEYQANDKIECDKNNCCSVYDSYSIGSESREALQKTAEMLGV